MSAGPTRQEHHPWRSLLNLIQPDDNLSAVIYGELITGATLASAVGRTASTLEMVLVTISTLAVYWIAHGYADVVAGRTGGGGQGPIPLRQTLRRELAMVTACLPPLVVLVVARGLGASSDIACYLALAYVALSLTGYGFRSARHAGLGVAAQILIALLHGVLGGAIILLKAEVLH